MTDLKDHDPEGHRLIQQYLRTGGQGMDPANTDWCASFVGSSVRQAGGTPPAGANVASNWARYGHGVDPNAVRRGDIVVNRRGRRPGATGGHVMIATGPADHGEVPVVEGDTRAPDWRPGH